MLQRFLSKRNLVDKTNRTKHLYIASFSIPGANPLTPQSRCLGKFYHSRDRLQFFQSLTEMRIAMLVKRPGLSCVFFAKLVDRRLRASFDKSIALHYCSYKSTMSPIHLFIRAASMLKFTLLPVSRPRDVPATSIRSFGQHLSELGSGALSGPPLFDNARSLFPSVQREMQDCLVAKQASCVAKTPVFVFDLVHILTNVKVSTHQTKQFH